MNPEGRFFCKWSKQPFPPRKKIYPNGSEKRQISLERLFNQEKFRLNVREFDYEFFFGVSFLVEKEND
jgi:hypothetical protein